MKTVNLDLTQIKDSAMVNAFRIQAEKEGWTKDEIKAVVRAATSGTTKHFVEVFSHYCQPVVNENDKYDDWGGNNEDDDDDDDSSDYKL